MRLGELGTVYRYERSGVMHGLLRVRGFTQDDAHIFCTPEQIEDEIVGCIDFALERAEDFGFDKFQTELSHLDPNDQKNFVGTEEQWNPATVAGESAEAAEISNTRRSPAKRRFTARRSTSSWSMPSDACGSSRPSVRLQPAASASAWNTSPKTAARKQPVMVHRALYGSVERFFGVLIEHYAGAFPVWLSPVQAVMIPIAERHVDYANKVADATEGRRSPRTKSMPATKR